MDSESAETAPALEAHAGDAEQRRGRRFPPRWTLAVALAALTAAAAVAFGALGGEEAGGEAESNPSTANSDSPSTEESTSPDLTAAQLLALAWEAQLPPGSELVEGHTADPGSSQLDIYSAPQPLGDCAPELSRPLSIGYFQAYREKRPAVILTSYGTPQPAIEIMAELREAWDTSCDSYETERDDGEEPGSHDRIAEIPAPEGYAEEAWAADCAVLRMLEDGSDGVIACTGLFAPDEHTLVEVTLIGHYSDRERYEELLVSIALEILANVAREG
jgi:hypothetical protein